MLPAAAESVLSDEEAIERVRNGETALYEVIMRRYNQRLFRVARAITGDDAEAEDVMQEAYVRAFAHLRQFEGRARFSTWLTKIAVYEAIMRARKRKRYDSIESFPELRAPRLGDPERQAGNAELRQALETAIASLPEHYRSVYLLRDVEELDTSETAACLGITARTVKVRLHRARAKLRSQLYRKARICAPFVFELPRCDRVVGAVLARIQGHTTT